MTRMLSPFETCVEKCRCGVVVPDDPEAGVAAPETVVIGSSSDEDSGSSPSVPEPEVLRSIESEARFELDTPGVLAGLCAAGDVTMCPSGPPSTPSAVAIFKGAAPVGSDEVLSCLLTSSGGADAVLDVPEGLSEESASACGTAGALFAREGGADDPRLLGASLNAQMLKLV